MVENFYLGTRIKYARRITFILLTQHEYKTIQQDTMRVKHETHEYNTSTIQHNTSPK